jgi:hypothetical protein
MNQEQAGEADFCLQIDFQKGSENPARIFTAMSNLISSLQQLDSDLIWSLDSGLQPILLLEDIQSGSIKTWLKQIIKSIDDDAIKELSWKKVVGGYLVKAKYCVINFLEGKTQITDSKDLIHLQNNLIGIAKETEIKTLPVYRPIPPQQLITDISRIQSAVNILGTRDTATYITQFNTASFNINLTIAPESIEDLITKETIKSETTIILKVKKPDYLGSSMWEFHFDDKAFPAKILDTDWLVGFQSRKIPVQPGDSLRVIVKTTVKYGHDNRVVGTVNEITKVIEVLPDLGDGQISFLDAIGPTY